MTRPRRITPGTTWAITNQTIFRLFLLRPDKSLNDIIHYCIARAASRTHVQIHAVEILSDHFHIVLTDVKGNLPDFMRKFDGLAARAINNLRGGRSGIFWSEGSYDYVELLTPEAVFDAMVYTLTNPVRHRLVKFAHNWPGFFTHPKDLGRKMKVSKPKRFFRQKRGLPDTLALYPEVPDIFADEGIDAFIQRLSAGITQRETELHKQAEANGDRYLGRRAILRQSPFASPETEAPFRNLNPRLKANNPGVLKAAKQQLLAFYAAYAEARDQFNAGLREVVFPYGTYQMKVQFAACCAGPDG